AVIVVLLLGAGAGFIMSPQRGDTPSPDATREEELVRQINQINEEFSPEFLRRYQELGAKLDAGGLVPDGPETQELIQMTEQLEVRHADRIGLLSELAKLRKTSLTEVIKDCDLLAYVHG